MEDQEKQIEILEQRFPLTSGNAMAAAYQSALDAGQKIMQVMDGQLWEVSKSGKTKVKDVEPDVHIGAGKSFNIP